MERLRPILMTSIVAIFGLLPASLATGLGSDVQRPLATVIVWGLFSSTTLTLFVVPVFYRILVPGMPTPEASADDEEADARSFVEPLPDVTTSEILGLLEYLHGRGGQEAIFHISEETNREFARVITVVKAAEMLGLVETPGHIVALTAKGRRFVEAGLEHRRALWREQLLTLGLFRDVLRLFQRQPGPRHRPRFRAGDDRHADALRELREGLQHLHPLGPLRRPVRLQRDDPADLAGAAGTGGIVRCEQQVGKNETTPDMDLLGPPRYCLWKRGRMNGRGPIQSKLVAAGGARPDPLAGSDAAGPARRAIGADGTPRRRFRAARLGRHGRPDRHRAARDCKATWASAYVRGLLRACQARGWPACC